MRMISLAFAALVASTATYAATDRSMSGMSGIPANLTDQNAGLLSGLSMDQQMALCSRLETLQKQGKALSTSAGKQLQVCRKMSAGMSEQPAPDATLDR